MALRRHYPRPDDLEVAVGRRLRQVRTDYRLSRRAIAEQIGLTPDRLNHVERGVVALRFGPGWKFCELTQTNPLWLAFGDQFPRIGFVQIVQITWEEQAAPFLSTMTGWAEAYKRYRAQRLKITPDHEQAFVRARVKIKTLVESGVKRYLTIMTAPSFTMTWEELRARLKAATRAPGAQAALARAFNVSTAAVSQWLSGTNAPKADTTLKLLQWVAVAEAKQKKSAGSVSEARPAPKDPNEEVQT